VSEGAVLVNINHPNAKNGRREAFQDFEVLLNYDRYWYTKRPGGKLVEGAPVIGVGTFEGLGLYMTGLCGSTEEVQESGGEFETSVEVFWDAVVFEPDPKVREAITAITGVGRALKSLDNEKTIEVIRLIRSGLRHPLTYWNTQKSGA